VADDDEVIERAVVEIGPQVTATFRKDLEAQVKTALAGWDPKAKVKLVADATGFRADAVKAIDDKLSGKPLSAKVKLVADATGFAASANKALKDYATGHKASEYKVKLVADATGLNASVAAATAAAGAHRVTIGADLDAADLPAKVQAAVAAAGVINVQVGIDVDAADLAAKVQAAATSAGGVDIKLGVDGAHLRNEVKLALALGEPYTIRIHPNIDTSGLGPLDRALNNTRRNANGMWGAIAPPRLINFGGRGIQPYNLLIGSLVALTPLMLALASSATQAGFALTALGTAGIGAGVALTGLVIGFKGIVEALQLRESVQKQQATTAANAARQQAIELKNQRAINDARKEAIRNLETLRRKVADLANQERGDLLSVDEAEANRAKVFHNFFASALDRRRAEQDVLDARNRLANTRLDRKQTGEDYTDAVKKGVNNSDAVTRAKASQTAVTSPAANLADRIAKMSPAARELYQLIADSQGTFEKLSRTIEQKVLPGFTRTLRTLLQVGSDGKSTLDVFAEAAGDLGAKFGWVAHELAHPTREKWFRRDFQKIIKSNAKFMDSSGRALVTLVKPFMTIFTRSGPLLERFGRYLERIATKFADFIDKADKDGSLQAFLKKAGDEFARWGGLLKEVGGFLVGIFTATKPAGGSLVDSLTTFFATANKWANSPEGQQDIKDFFQGLADLPFAKIRDTIVQLSTVVAAGAAARFVFQNPLWSLLAMLAKNNPEQAQQFLGALSSFIIDTLGYLEKHERQAELLLAILAAYKLAATAGKLKMAFGAISVPTIAVAGAVVAGTFVAEWITGKDASESIKDNFDVPGTVREQREAGQGPPILGSKVDQLLDDFVTGYLRHWFAITLPNALNDTVGQGGWAGLGHAMQRWFSHDLPDMLNLGEGSGWSALGTNLGRWFTETLPNALSGGGASSWADFGPWMLRQAKEDIGEMIPDGMWEGIKSGTTDLWNNITGWASDFWDWLKKKCGIRSPSTIAAGIGGNIVAGLWQGIVDKWTSLTTAVDTWIEQSFLGPLLNKFTTAGQTIAAGFAAGFSGITAKLSGPISTVKSWLNQNLISPLNVLLKGLFLPEIPLLNASAGTAGGGLGNAAGNAAINLGDALKRADGGTIPGYSPNSRADNIPALLTAGEYVQPVAAVKHYGPQFMEAVRTRQLPRYADGGAVGGLIPAVGASLPARMATAKLKGFSLQQLAGRVLTGLGSAVYDAISGGKASGDVQVAETAEATARSMGATDKQLVALIAAGLVESGLRNINYGDDDSVGFLQQRPSQGWGSVEQLLNVAYATRKFINAAKSIDSQRISAGELAARVQRPKAEYRGRYARREADAVAVLNRAAPLLAGGSAVTGGGQDRYAGRIDPALGRVNNVTNAIYQAIVAAHGAFPGARVTSSYRPGSVTKSGNVSYHARNPSRAADFAPPSMGLFDYFRGRYPGARELIYSPAGNAQLKDGRPHFYTGDVRADHWDHVHLALANGGKVPARKYDTGGTLPPGYTLAFNGTGRNETIRTHQQEKQLGGPVRLDKRDIALLATHIAAASNQTVHMDGRKVAEITNAYTYLPAGV
jgi:hypothetical protein